MWANLTKVSCILPLNIPFTPLSVKNLAHVKIRIHFSNPVTTKDLGAFVSEASSTLQSLDTQLSGAVSGDDVESTSFPRPPPPALAGSSAGSTPLVVDGEILDIASPPGLTVGARVASVSNSLMRYDSTFTSPLSPDYDLVEQSELDAFVEGFDANSKTAEIEVLLSDGGDGGVKEAFEEFVPEIVPYKEFWTRYFFRFSDVEGSLERNEMIVHRLQQEFDDGIVDGIGSLLSGVGSRLQKVKQTVAAKVTEVAADFDATMAATTEDAEGYEGALKAKNDEIKRLRSEFAVALKAKEMEVEDMTRRIVELQMEEEKREEASGGAPPPQKKEQDLGGAQPDHARAADEGETLQKIAAAVESATSELQQRLEVRLKDAVKREGETWAAKVGEVEEELGRRNEAIKGVEEVVERCREEIGRLKEGKKTLEEEKKTLEEEKKMMEEAMKVVEVKEVEAKEEGTDAEATIAKLKEEVLTWQGRAQKCRDDRTLVVAEKKKSDALLNSTVSELRDQVAMLEKRAGAAEERAERAERADKESVKSNASSGVMVQEQVKEEGEEDGWGGWGDDDE